MTITVEQYLTHHPEPETEEHAAWVARVIEESGPDIWAYAEPADQAIDEVVAERMGRDDRGRAIIRFAARQAIRAGLGPRGYWMLGWYDGWLSGEAEREHRRLWAQATRIIDDVIASSRAERIWERAG